jgi:hypothetical protein
MRSFGTPTSSSRGFIALPLLEGAKISSTARLSCSPRVEGWGVLRVARPLVVRCLLRQKRYVAYGDPQLIITKQTHFLESHPRKSKGGSLRSLRAAGGCLRRGGRPGDITTFRRSNGLFPQEPTYSPATPRLRTLGVGLSDSGRGGVGWVSRTSG